MWGFKTLMTNSWAACVYKSFHPWSVFTLGYVCFSSSSWGLPILQQGRGHICHFYLYSPYFMWGLWYPESYSSRVKTTLSSCQFRTDPYTFSIYLGHFHVLCGVRLQMLPLGFNCQEHSSVKSGTLPILTISIWCRS